MSTAERLGAAIHAFTGGWSNTTFDESADIAREQAAAILAADPELAEALELGLAWREAEAALPEGRVLAEVRIFDDRSAWGAEAANDTGVGRYREMGYGPTPTAALIALTKSLRGSREKE